MLSSSDLFICMMSVRWECFVFFLFLCYPILYAVKKQFYEEGGENVSDTVRNCVSPSYTLLLLDD